MKTYLVGGAVRDKLINIPIKDRDWVVVGATVEEMLAHKFLQVGKDFPVFIHPRSKEEYALARTERKTGKGYTGFTVHAAPNVTLEQDLARRDLTINAMAETDSGEIIDPYNGQADIAKKLLRHVSPAFSEDPLRVLRVARFAARFAHLGFTVAEETMTLMQEMSAADELQHLVAERVWQEIQQSLSEKSPQVFIQCLKECQALAKILPEISALFGVPQNQQHHPEIDTGLHTLLVLEQACILSPDPCVRFAGLVHDLGKALTPAEQLPHHPDHEARGAKLVSALCQRLKAPNEYRELAVMTSRFHADCHRADRHSAEELYQTLEHTDAFRRPQRFALFLLACEADSKGRPGYEQNSYPQGGILTKALHLANTIKAASLLAEGYQGKALGEQIKLRRIEAIKAAVLSTH